MIVHYAVYRLADLRVISNVVVLDLDSLSESTPYLRQLACKGSRLSSIPFAD